MKELTEMTATELVAEHDRLCGPENRIDGPWKRSKAELAARIEALGGTEAVERTARTAREAPAGGAEPQTVGALVEALLATGMDYGGIVAAVRGRFPDARTTRRSVASVACRLRRAGVAVPLRRARVPTSTSN